MHLNSVKEFVSAFFKSQKFYLFSGIAGVAGMISTSGLFATGFKDAIANAKHKNRKGMWKGILKMLPMLAFAATTIISIITSYRIFTGKLNEANGAIARLSNLAMPALATGGTKMEDAIDKATDKIAEDVKTEKPAETNKESDTIEMIDSISGRRFQSSIFKVKQALNDFNAKLVSSQDFMTINDWYYYLGISEVGIGDDLGFQIDAQGNGLLRIDFQPKIVDDKPITYIIYRVKPHSEDSRGY